MGHDTVFVSTAGARYSFLDPNSGINKPVTETGATLAGPDAANYRLIVRNGTANIDPVSITIHVASATKIIGTPNPPFSAAYNDDSMPGIDVPTLLANLTFETSATAQSSPGTYTISAVSSDPNVRLRVVPGTLTVVFADSPQIDPALTTAGLFRSVPLLSATGLSPGWAPSGLSTFQIIYPTNSDKPDGALDSFSPWGAGNVSNATHRGSVRPW